MVQVNTTYIRLPRNTIGMVGYDLLVKCEAGTLNKWFGF